MNYMPIEELLKSQIVNNELYSFQIVAILLALEQFAGLNNNGVSAYHGWINSRKKRQPFQSTINLAILARSFELNGFSDNFPLEVDPDDLMLNGGTHRTACSLFYGIQKVPTIFKVRTGEAKASPKYYGLDYFKDSSYFDKTIITEMESRWNKILQTKRLI